MNAELLISMCRCFNSSYKALNFKSRYFITKQAKAVYELFSQGYSNIDISQKMEINLYIVKKIQKVIFDNKDKLL